MSTTEHSTGLFDLMNDTKAFYRRAVALILPIALQNLINVGISSIDVVMLGRVGETVLSGASLGSQIQFILNLILFGATSGAAILMAQYWGKGDGVAVGRIFGMVLKLTLLISLVITVLVFTFPQNAIAIFTNDDAVRAQGAQYLRIVCLSYLPMTFTMVYLNTMRSLGKVRIASVVYLCSMLTNIAVNAVLIFGLFGVPKMGIRGAAIGTLCARLVEIAVVTVYNCKINRTFPLRWHYFLAFDRVLAKDYVRYSLPVLFNEMMWGTGCSTITAILGHMGSAAVAANSVAQVVRQLATVASFGVASAAAVMVGQTLGEGRKELAKQYADRLVRLAMLLSLVGAGLILLIRPLILSGVAISEEAVHYLSVMLLVMCYFVIAQVYNTVVIVGILRGGGDTKFGFMVDVIFMWGIAILFGFIAAFVLKWSVIPVYLILTCDEILKVPASALRYRSKKWLNNITRETT
ncbi:MAG: MATE family efflux transporter [Butyricicoccaceae bacterium]